MSGLLLDTNALLWVLSDAPALGPSARASIAAADRVHFSSVSAVEVTTKVMLGRLEVPGDVAGAATSIGLVELPLTGRHAELMHEFPQLVRHDPFDRMLLAQAVHESMTLLTSDRTLLSLGRDDVLPAGR